MTLDKKAGNAFDAAGLLISVRLDALLRQL
jgi:hypothetical protein